MLKRPEPDPQFQAIKYQGKNIVIEKLPLPAGVRVFLGVLFLPALVLGLKGCYELAKLALGFGNGSENIAIGVGVTIAFILIPSVGLWLAIDSGKRLVLNPKTKQAHLTKRSIFRTVERQFLFRALKPCFLRQDTESTRFWSGVMRLPDRTRIDFIGDGHVDYKEFAEMWRDRINAMIEL
ncbi:MAG: hypothetical protein AAFY82_02295 [Pseudomonadota bacterium]